MNADRPASGAVPGRLAPEGQARRVFDLYRHHDAQSGAVDVGRSHECFEFEPVRLADRRRFATDHLLTTGGQPFSRAVQSGIRVAVVGGGPFSAT